MSSKSISKSSKKRKVGPLGDDLSQRRLERFFSSSQSVSPIKSPTSTAATSRMPSSATAAQMEEGDPMELDTSRSTAASTMSPPFLGTLKQHQQRLLPTITIANCSPARKTELSAEDFNITWNKQKALVINIFTSDQSSKAHLNFCTASRLSEGLCRYGKAEQLFESLKGEIEVHVRRLQDMLNTTLRERAEHTQEQCEDTTFLQNLYTSWTTYCQHLSILRNVFMELDRTYILSNTKYSSIIHLGKEVFSEVILNNAELRNAIMNDIIQLITSEREKTSYKQKQQQQQQQQPELRKLIQATVYMLIELDHYSSDFEPWFIKKTISYYRAEANKLLIQQNMDISDYLQHCQCRYEEEIDQRLKTYLDPHTKQALEDAVKNELVCNKVQFILDKGFEKMMEKPQIAPLKTLYNQLAEQNQKLQLLRQAFGLYIKSHGSRILSSTSNQETSLITLLVKFLMRVNKVLRNSFRNDEGFLNTTKESFEIFINERGNKPAELLARFFDSRLKVSVNKKNEDESENSQIKVLDLALSLFRYIQAKDMFEQFYKRALSKRLLLDRSISHDLEKHVLEKLKLECGDEFTKDMEKMFQDIQVSADLQYEFSEQQKIKTAKTKKQPLNMIVKVVNTSVWPTYPNSNLVLPLNMVKTQMAFEEFYSGKFKERKLTWQNSLSSCTVLAHYPKGTKEIVCNLAQSVILLIFNDTEKESFTFSEIEALCRLEKKELLSLLYSISSNDYRLIKFEPVKPQSGRANAITANDRFKFNVDFAAPSVRLKLPPPKMDPTADKTKDVEKKVHVNRQHQVEAAIVRIMKKNKQMTHNNLMKELMQQQIFRSIEASDIKKRIESLIDREYMNRDAEDSSLYIYQN